MADAIRKKRMGSIDMSTPEAPAEQEGGKDLLGLVAALSQTEREQLKDILHASTSDMSIQKGEASSDEQSKIAERMTQEGEESADVEAGEEQVDSDEIGKSMLDSRTRNGAPEGVKPRNLGERVKFGIADKLKGKGKL